MTERRWAGRRGCCLWGDSFWICWSAQLNTLSLLDFHPVGPETPSVMSLACFIYSLPPFTPCAVCGAAAAGAEGSVVLWPRSLVPRPLSVTSMSPGDRPQQWAVSLWWRCSRSRSAQWWKWRSGRQQHYQLYASSLCYRPREAPCMRTVHSQLVTCLMSEWAGKCTRLGSCPMDIVFFCLFFNGWNL